MSKALQNNINFLLVQTFNKKLLTTKKYALDF